MALSKVVNWLLAGKKTQKSPLHRQLLVISGDEETGLARAHQLFHALPQPMDTCWLGDNPAPGANRHPVKQYSALLGNEYDVVFYNAFSSFRPSAFLAAAGTVVRGGRLILICPYLQHWPAHEAALDAHFVSYGYHLRESHFLSRFCRELIRQQHTVALWTTDALSLPLFRAPEVSTLPPPFATRDQLTGFNQLSALTDNERFAAIVTAPRGRGKSALMGMMAAALINKGERILLTSSLKRNVGALINHCEKSGNGQFQWATDKSGIACNHTGGVLKWVAPDSPSIETASADLLIIDEAASLPLPLIRRITSMHTRMILGTTTQGYEGSGKGFLRRFVPWLSARIPVHNVQLSEPVRYSPGDPLETLFSATLLIEDVFDTGDDKAITAAEVAFQFTSLPQLPESDYKAVIRLLSTAHYQTTPDDIMRITDAPDAMLVTGKYEDRIIAACIINAEGGDKLRSVAADIAHGRRRVKGHLAAQRLGLFAASADVVSARYWRINRIAVSPEFQGHGIGSRALAYIQEHALNEHIDIVVSAFGYTEKLNHFWQNAGYRTVNYAQRADKASGEKSVIVARPVNPDHSDTVEMLISMAYLDYHAAHVFSETMHLPENIVRMSLQRLQDFADGTRSFDQLGIAWSLFLHHVPTFTEQHIAENPQALYSLTKLVVLLNAPGKKDAVTQLRTIVRTKLPTLRGV